VYWRLDDLRSDNASLRMHLSHFHGKDDNSWLSLVLSCACHNLNVSTAIREACAPYLYEMAGRETPAFLEALALLPGEKKASKESKAKTRHALYEKDKAKAGGGPLPKMKGKKPPKKEKPAPNGKKYVSSKWAWAADLPILNHNPKE
jgi:hypothetical protein